MTRLTREQLAVVHHGQGHARVSAVAGSGKSSTLVERVAWLMEQGVAHQRILVVMFNVAAREGFEQRLRQRLGAQPMPTVRTFHALGLRLCATLVRAGALPDWRLVSEAWPRQRLCEEALLGVAPELARAGREQLRSEVELFSGFVDRVGADLIDAASQFERLDFDAELRHFVPAFERFQRLRERQGLRFFTDLIGDPVCALEAEPSARALVADRLDHLIIDEYQDINPIQQRLIRHLAGRRAAVMAVGDADQCIYAWRGAEPSFMAHRFGEDFPRASDYRLSYTFRYGHRLSLAASHVIRHNHPTTEGELCLSHHANPQTRIEWMEEGRADLPKRLQDWRAEGRSLREAVLLVRLFSMSALHELALLGAGIPYRLEGREPVLTQPEVGALCGHLGLAAGHLFDLPMTERRERVHQMLTIPPMGLSREVVERLEGAILAKPKAAVALFEAAIPAKAHPKQVERLRERAALWGALAAGQVGVSVDALLRRVVSALHMDEGLLFSSGRAELAEERKLLVEAFIRFAAQCGEPLQAFVERLAEYRARPTTPAGDALLITSIHRAKGLEWPLVIVPGLEEGRFPFYVGGSIEGGGEDERRLFYVAITRAQERLWLLHPGDTTFESWREQGSGEAPWGLGRGRASRFLYESNLALSDAVGSALGAATLPETPLRAVECRVARRYLHALGTTLPIEHQPPRTPGVESSATGVAPWRRGQRVRHARFGTGVVVCVSPEGEKVQVRFGNEGLKWLMLSYAKLEPL